jgi:hypothetical protein
MKLRLVLMFSVVIALLSFTAIADQDVKEFEIKFKGDGYFDMFIDEDGLLVFTPPGGFDLLNVSHLGKSEVAWTLRVNPLTYEFVDGTFTITGANDRDGLEGHFSNFVLGIGEYDLDWVFTGGTGRFEGAEGTGHTDGLVDFGPPPYAKFEFSGVVTVPKGKE